MPSRDSVDLIAKLPFYKVMKELLFQSLSLRDWVCKTFASNGQLKIQNASSEFATLRLDPEGIRVGPEGTFYISDEYGPYVFEFNRQGHLIRRNNIPSKFAMANPSADPNAELLGNSSWRQANRGMEGLAISPHGRFLFGMMQNALLQDNGLNPPPSTDRLGLNNRILKIVLVNGETHEYVYVLEAINRGQDYEGKHFPNASKSFRDPFMRILLRSKAQTRLRSFAIKPSHTRVSAVT